MRNHKLEVGSNDVIILDKMFGPTIMCNLRITADTNKVMWIIERQKFIEDEEGNFIESQWEKVAEINAQESIFSR